jgi:AAA+ ATPase superfamily predicted ATPase
MIGRDEEVKLLEKKYNAKKSDFIALFGRRRVGKTYLIRSVFKDRYTFQLTGLADASLNDQLLNFKIAVAEQHPKLEFNSPNHWLEAFQVIKQIIINSNKTKKVIFFDELPWLDTAKSGFLQALESFWNSWASARKDVLLIVCGSAASWMINKLINNKGGLHNRVTARLRIEPFTLKECETYVKKKKLALDHYQIVQLYMVLGGIPFYWEEVEKGLSATQNINEICFAKNGLLKFEFQNVFKSLFNKSERHESIIEALAKKGMGLTRDEIIAYTKMTNGGGLTRILNELEESGFIRKYIPFGKKSKNGLYQLSDFYSLFYYRFMADKKQFDTDYWSKMIDHPSYRSWSGYAFEQVCLYHTNQIKKALGISGIETQISAWRSSNSNTNTQIDLIIDRRDQIINLCEMKFSINKFQINKKYDAELRNKAGVFKEETKTRKSVFLTLVTTFGVLENEYSGNIQSQVNMEKLFE